MKRGRHRLITIQPRITTHNFRIEIICLLQGVKPFELSVLITTNANIEVRPLIKYTNLTASPHQKEVLSTIRTMLFYM